MAYTYVMGHIAQEEYEASVKWYLARSPDAATSFIAAVEHTLELICEHPYRWRNAYQHFYELGVKKFPFTIIYIIEEARELIVVMAVYHHKRNPRKKYRRDK